MSRSKRDQKGRRRNGEIYGYGEYQVVGGKVYAACGGSPVGSPSHKKWSKKMVVRHRRREDRRIVNSEV